MERISRNIDPSGGTGMDFFSESSPESSVPNTALLTLEVMGSFFGHRTSDIGHRILLKLAEEVKAGRKLRGAFSELALVDQEYLRSRIGNRSCNELLSLSREDDPELFFEALLHFGLRFKARQDLDRAAAVLGFLSQANSLAAGGHEARPYKIPNDVETRAALELNAILGKGDLGMRFEVLGGGLAKESTNWRAIGPMVGASIIGNLVGTGMLTRLVTGTSGRWFSRGLGARFVSGLTGYGAEFPLYAGLNYAVTPHPQQSFWHSLEGAAVTIGILKSFNFGGQQVFKALHGFDAAGLPTRLAGWAKLTQPLIPQASIFLGLYHAHKLEEWVGLRDPMDDATLAADTLHSMVTLGVGGRLGHGALGREFAAFQQRIHLHAERLGKVKSYERVDTGGRGFGPELAYAGGPRGIETERRREGETERKTRIKKFFWDVIKFPMWMAMGMGPGGGGGGDGKGVDRHDQQRLSKFRDRIEKLPASNPLRDSLLQRLSEVSEKLSAEPFKIDLLRELGPLERELDSAWGRTLAERVEALRGALGELVEAAGDSTLKERLQHYLSTYELTKGTPSEPKEWLLNWNILFLDTVMKFAEAEWGKVTGSPVPAALNDSLLPIWQSLLTLDLIREGIPAESLRQLIREVALFYRDFRPQGPGGYLRLKDALNEGNGFLLGAQPEGASYLNNITHNLRGHRRLFGEMAGPLFYHQARVMTEIRDAQGRGTGFFLAMERGEHEFANGVRLAIFDEDPRQSYSHHYLAKVGLHFGPNDTLRIINIQGSARNSVYGPHRNVAGERKVTALLGGAHPLDALVATAILLGRNAGFDKMEGIRDAAHHARIEKMKAEQRPQGFYDLFFRKFGFRPSEGEGDYWSLDLQDLEIARKNLPPIEELSLEEYFNHVLVRRNRDESGKNTRPKTWDRQAPDRHHPAVIAFRQVVAALSEATWVPATLAVKEIPVAKNPTPFILGDLKPRQTSADETFFEASRRSTSPTALAKEFEAEYQKVLQQGREGKISPQRTEAKLAAVLQKDFVEKLRQHGASVDQYSIEDYLGGLKLQHARLPGWVDEIGMNRRIQDLRAIQVTLDATAYNRYFDAKVKERDPLDFLEGTLGYLADEMEIPRRAFFQRADGKLSFVLLPMEFYQQALKLRGGEEAITTQMVPGILPESELKQVRYHLANRRRVIALSNSAQDLHEFKELHPFLAMLHDVFHAHKLNNHIKEIPELVILHDVFTEMAASEPWLGELASNLLDGVYTNESLHTKLFEKIRDTSPSLELDREIYDRLAEKFSGSARGRAILKAYRTAVFHRWYTDTSFFSEGLKEIDKVGKPQIVTGPDGELREETPLSDIGPLFLADLKVIMQRAVDEEISPHLARVEAVKVLQEDWVRGFGRHGAPITESSFLKYLEGLENEGREIPWLKAYRKNRFARNAPMQEIAIDKPTLEKIAAQDPAVFYEVSVALGMLKLVEEELALKHGDLFAETPEGGYRIRIPPAEFFLEGPRILNPESPLGIEMKVRLSSEEEMKRLASRHSHALLVTIFAQNLHDMEGTHPFAAFLHDVYHILKLAKLSFETREELLGLHRALEKTAPGADDELWVALISNVLEGNPNPTPEGSHRPLFEIIRNHGSFKFQSAYFYELIQEFKDSERGRRILREFQEIVVGKNSEPPSGSPGESGSGALYSVAWPALLAMGEGKLALTALGLSLLAMAVTRKGSGEKMSETEKPDALVKVETPRSLEKPEGPEKKPGALQALGKEVKSRDVSNVVAAGGVTALAGAVFGPTGALIVGAVTTLTTLYDTFSRRDRWGRMLAFFRGSIIGAGSESLGGGPYRSGTYTNPLSPLEYETAFELRQEMKDSNLSPLVRQQKLQEYGHYLKRLESTDEEFRKGMIALGQVLLHSGVTEPHYEKGLPAIYQPDLSEKTYGDDWALRREALRLAQDALEPLDPQDIAVVEFTKVLYQGLASPRVHRFRIDRLDAFMSTQKDKRADEVLHGLDVSRGEALNRMRREFLRALLGYLPNLPAESSLANSVMKLLRQKELMIQAEGENEFRENLVRAYLALVPLLRRDHDEMDKTYEVLRELFAEDLETAQLAAPAGVPALPEGSKIGEDGGSGGL